MTGIDAATQPSGDGDLAVPRRKAVVYCLAIISLATAVIHFAVAGEHFQEYWAFGVFLLSAAWLQLLWAIMAVTVISKPSRLLLWSGAILNAGVVAVYVVTRTAGDIVGPTPHAVEPFGFGDGLCTVLEAVIVGGCAWLLIAKMNQPVRRRHLVMASATVGVITAALLSVSLVAGGPEMVMSSSAADSPGTGGAAGTSSSAMHRSETGSTPIRLATSSPAGDITMPDTNMQMAPGMKMASPAACTAMPTKDQQKAAVSLVNSSWKGAGRFQSLAAAKAAGYRPVTPTGAPIVHYVNPSYYIATLMGGPALNTSKPQSLVYANTPKGAVLAAAMYIAPRDGATPQPGGCLTQWHVHTNLCFSRGLGVVGVARPSCPAGSTNRVTPPMMHIWFVPIPGGPTAIDAPNPQVVRAAEQVSAPANGTA
jgi:hypothetical protein